MPTLDALAAWLQSRLQEPRPLWRPGPPDVRHLALALDPDDLPQSPRADALFLHRAFRLGDRYAPLGVLTAHDGFDAHLTTGQNHALAHALQWRDLRPLDHQGRTYGLTATPPQATWPALLAALTDELGGVEETRPPTRPAARVALMNAMRPELLQAAHDHGANVYVTGQLRPGALARAHELGVGIVALGHRRSEVWGLQQLARELRAAFPDLRPHVHTG
ncbi:Nif3-like dinuclear metal center hexameric protein [Deinococcus maricopensis]|uniref:NGG1p interacting factor 3 protein, NIF3 n=1 Tax=Deinococcus maricopensis (strain DSM 21211 / LMG 22137 / NRRL B-23946 / LB-34) TaxID=709986 RepID=E8U8H1_DEIML|nr:Nif3-like dinuclear metal center hexameric protein [Deinococcus maricopensis]ADV67360.1 NGG1p interacting factor 3 protein, NIF3 [Deinococcus maricopensis DSM 21211]